ncbi:MAG TPA: OmpA family protein [Steroidobacteraceae bacterium]|nr:OmpA family protein [Steroidobacteraceae bacterium]
MKKALLLCALALPALAVAQPGDEWYLTPQVGGISPDHERDLTKHDWLYGLGAGRELGRYINLELNFNGARINDGRGLGHLDTYGGSLDVLGVLNRGGLFAPYLSLGAGAVQDNFINLPDRNRTDFMTQAGVGMFVNLWRSPSGTSGFALRPDIKARWDDPGKGAHLVDYIATLGFQFSFGGSPIAPPAPPPPPPPPPPAAQPAPAPAAVPVTPPDSDHDGVPDAIDQCPNTPPGVQVDAVGCPIKGSVTLEGVNFEHNSADLTEASHAPLDDVATGLKKHPRLKVEIQGHTDSTGTPAYNLKLSQRRADSVRDYLVQQGVSADQLVTKGYGQAQPVASNASAAGRARNRRVVMYVLSNPGDVKVEGEGSAQQQ